MEVWGCFLMSGVRMLHFFKDWWKFTRIHQYYTMALIRFEIITLRLIYMLAADWACFEYSYDSIDRMHMMSQKGAPACWGSHEALSRAPSPSMQPAGQPLHAIPLGRPGPAHWPRAERLRVPTLFQHNTCAQRDKSWPPSWRRCYGDVTSMHKVYCVHCTLRAMWWLCWNNSHPYHLYFEKLKMNEQFIK